MSLTPHDIEHVSFKRELRGYAEDEVDVFLDRVHARLSELLREREELRERIVEVERHAAESAEAEVLLKRTLIAAQRTADDTVEEARRTAEAAVAEAREIAEHTVGDARAEAEHTLTEANQEALRTRTSASEEAERTIQDARTEAEETIARARAHAQRMLGEAQQRAAAQYESARVAAERSRRVVEELHRFRTDYRDRVRDVITEQLDLLERTGDIPDPPQGLEELAVQAEELAAAAQRSLADDVRAPGDGGG
jgi:DivIVA domain-containing protein